MIYDILVFAIFALLIFIGIRRGAAKSLANLLLTFVSYTAATFVGKLLSVNIYNLVLRPTIHDTVVNTVTDFSHKTLDTGLQDAFNKVDLSDVSILGIPVGEPLDNALDSVKNNIQSFVTGKMDGPIDNVAVSAGETAETVVEPIVIGIMSFFITIFLFFLFYILLRKFVLPLLLKVFKLPVIKQVNMILGGVIGAVDAFLLVSMAAYLLRLVIPQVSTDLTLLKESTIYSSFIFKLFYDGNIFTTFASWLAI